MDNCMKVDATSIKREAEEDGNSRSPKKINMDAEENVDSEENVNSEDSEEEHHFARLFNEALEFIQKTMRVSEEELLSAIITVIESFTGCRMMTVDFDISANLCAYFYRWSQLSTELSRFKILEAIDKCEEFRCKLKEEKDVVNVVSVGGGAGCDIIGFCSAIYGKAKIKELDITVVDLKKRWKSFLQVLEFLLRDGDFGNASRMVQESNTNIKFIAKDVCEVDSQSTDYSIALKNADFILMKHILSVISFREGDFAIENVSLNMKEGALVLFIGTPSIFYQWKEFGFKKIYTSCSLEKETKYFFIKGQNVIDHHPGLAKTSSAQIEVYVKK